MIQPDLEETIEHKGKTYLIKQYFSSNFQELNRPSQSYGLILNNKKEVLLISEDANKWTLPGGTIEVDETPEEALAREIYEESAVVIDSDFIIPFFYNVNYELINDEYIYNTTQLRFISKVKKIDKFIRDPGGNVKYRKFVPLEDFDKVLHWKKIGPLIKSHLEQFLRTTSID